MCKVGLLLTFFHAILAVVYSEKHTQIVATKQGRIEGYISSNHLYYEFAGIPYAKAVKFRAPLPPSPFKGIFKANDRDVFCPQFPSNDMFAAPSDNENCLVLNIFTPTSYLTNITLPVMVYLHGGDFGVGSGSPDFYGPQYLVSQGVIVVTVNYRLNVYGFLNLGIKEAPGNAGLKDIRAALRWIKENIANFGGDPDNVTVFGQGSGGIAAIYLMLSKTTVGLCQRIISQSGTLFTPKSIDNKPLATASQLAKSLNINTKDPEELFNIYKETQVDKVEEAISKQMNAKSFFLPSVEKHFEGEEAFLTDTSFNILAAGVKHESFNPLPVVIGLNTMEGLTSTLDYNTMTSQINRIKHGDLSALDQRSLSIPEDERAEFRRIVNGTYFSNGTDSDEKIVGGLINVNSDFSYVGPMSLFTEMLANQSGLPVYEYIFDYVGNRNLGRILTNSSLAATTNMDELIYLFELNRLPLPMNESDARIITFMTMMWTNFAKFGNPTPEGNNGSWMPAPYRLALLLEPKYVAPLTPERAYFWRTFYFRYGVDILKN